MIRVGPAGWAYKDWNGKVYPERPPKDFGPLTFLARYFDTVEINTSYYGPFKAETAAAWAEQVAANARFRFTAKLYRGFTHTREVTKDEEALVHAGFDFLLQRELLGAVLLQFPSSFHETKENREYMIQLRNRFRDYPLVLEVRHTSWNEVGVLDFLASLGISLCNIDQPLFKKSIAPSALVTAPVGYVRLHGRNYKSWWTENKHVGERYDYLYTPKELDPWIDRIHAIAERAEDTYVVTNNHYLGKAVVNAVEITSLLTGEPAQAPATLFESYPELREYAK